jgi:His/Glu/Gln/Arg/opine family amino acid ABC transporter permease subunit
MLLVGYWGTLNRLVVGIMAVIAGLMLVIPATTRNITPPDIYFFATPAKIDQVNFVAEEGQPITFTLNPLAEPEEFGVDTFPGGYIGNDSDLGNTSWVLFSTASGQVANGQLDPTLYNLRLAIQVWNRDGQPIATSEFTEAPDESVTLTFDPPASGWYTFTMIRDEENPGDAGSAWLKAEDLDSFYSTPYYQTRREERYGLPPELDCQGCNTDVNRTDMRFEGERTFIQWVGLQLAPFLEMIRRFYFITLAVIFAAYGIGKYLSGTRTPANVKYIGRGMLALWLLAVPIWYLLIFGTGIGPLADTFPSISTRNIGGLLLTTIFTVIPLVASFPLGIVLALGRRSDLPAVSWVSTAFIEVFRGVPLITLLFLGFYIVQYFADFMRDLDIAIRLMIVITFFTAAYLAEVIRGGLQVIPKGQLEAAYAVGLNGFWTNILIILPQALRAVIPAILGQFLSLFKDTSLLALVSLFEITGAMRRVLGDPFYTAFGREGWIFVFIVYFLLSYAMAEASRKLEESGSGAVRRNQI